MKKRILTLLCVVILIALCTLTVSAEEGKRAVYDRVGLFTQEEIASLEAQAKKYYSKLDADVYIVTDDSEGSYIYGNYFLPYTGDKFTNEYGITGDSVILIITANSNRNYDLYTYGEAYSALSDSDVDTILDHRDVYGNIKNEKYFDGAMAFISISADEYALNIDELLIIAIVISVIVTAIFLGCTYYSYNKKLRSEKYPLNRYASLELTHRDDAFAGSFVTKRRIQSSSGGRSGGGRSGGGGGGGHRGGR